MSQPRQVIHLPKVRMLSRGNRSGIRISSVRTIKPPDPELVRKQQEEELRAQLQKEIVSRSRQCANKSYECHLPVVSGRAYCARHILQDPTAPYKRCAHTDPNGERCAEPAPRDQRDMREHRLCFTHAREALAARQRSAAPPPPVTTTETLLNQLQHYVKPERTRTQSCASSVSVVSDQGEQDQGVPAAVDPFKQIDATAVNSQYSSNIMECGSASDSDEDSLRLGEGGNSRAQHSDLDDMDDAPCEDTPLWRAGVFTAEEAVSEARDTLVSLQEAYTRQMGRLRVLLSMARSEYLKSLKAEKEQYCSINTQAKNSPPTAKTRRQLRRLKAMAGHHRRRGVDAVLARKLHHKRAKLGVEGTNRPPPSLGRCTFTEGGVRCGRHSLPAAKHCMRHILQDTHQVLFTACGDTRGCGCCSEPLAKLPLPSAACRYHTNPPPYTTFTLKKDESDSDSESHSSSDESRMEEAASYQNTETPADVYE